MDYKIRIPKCYGSVIPLECVAVAMATAEATAFGNADFHEPVYPGAYRKIRDSLLDEIKKEGLEICDQRGFSISYADALKQSSMQVITRFVNEPDWALLEKQHPEAKTATGYDWTVVKPAIDFGPSEIDVVASIFLRLHTRIDQLNAWGEKRHGSAFSIDDNAPPWHDERGVMGLPELVAVGMPDQPNTIGLSKVPANSDWVENVRKIAIEYIAKHKTNGLFPSQSDVCEHVEIKARDLKIYGPQGRPISKSYIQRNAIQGAWWKNNKP